MVRALRAAGVEVSDEGLSRALYTSDAGLHRLVPTAIAFPRDGAEVATVVRCCLDTATPLTPRGAGTSCAGNALGTGVVQDLSRHLTRILSIDPDEATARVQPGVVQAHLQAAARPHGLRFGPDPSTSDRCTIGGMIGNNACGPRALGYGRTADNVVALTAVLGTGETVRVGPGLPVTSPTLRALERLVGDHLALIRTEFGRFSRQVSGYSLEHLLPENDFDVASFLAGTEGTLAVTVEATVRLVEDKPFTTMVALGYPSMPEAADDAPLLAEVGATAAEGLDRRMVDVVVRRQGPGSVPALPDGDAWMLVELVDDDERRLAERAAALLEQARAADGWVVEDPVATAALWKIRADGAGLAETSLERPAYGGWEDAAVPPARLGEYLRAFEDLLARHDLHALPYGHFGEGCVHCRIDFPLGVPGGRDAYAAFVEEAAALVGRFGGSMSGEHGDGRARSGLLRHMYSPEALALMARVKALLDPEGILNPGVIVDPEAVGSHLRVAQAADSPLARTELAFVEEVHRCSGVGKCLTDGPGGGTVMCPSYQATGEEKDSTRGRSRVLQEMVNGELVSGWDSPEVSEALDLCLSCKGCARDCPTGVDMASYKSIVLHRRYRGRLRPRQHYSLGWLPAWSALVSRLRLGRLVNAATGVEHPLLARLMRWSAGVDARRSIPRLARRSARRSLAHVKRAEAQQRVAVWVDSFSDAFEDGRAAPVVELLERAGFGVEVVGRRACCGLTYLSTGQRGLARRSMLAALDVLEPVARRGVRIVGIEPSCLATWRSDADELIGDDPRLARVQGAMCTLAEVLGDAPAWTPPDLSAVTVVAQPHCHHASVLGWSTDLAVLARTGATVRTVGGCCGLAGNFGVERGHYETSVAVAETQLLPAVRAAGEQTVVLADGFSCRIQLRELARRPALTLAELLLAQPAASTPVLTSTKTAPPSNTR
nr:FAD-binding and (Fe-S)-binding domain-containing protein [Nocardioides acrostichi]